MSIVNLVLKPFICFVLYRVYLARGGSFQAELNSVRGEISGEGEIDDGGNGGLVMPCFYLEP